MSQWNRGEAVRVDGNGMGQPFTRYEADPPPAESDGRGGDVGGVRPKFFVPIVLQKQDGSPSRTVLVEGLPTGPWCSLAENPGTSSEYWRLQKLTPEAKDA